MKVSELKQLLEKIPDDLDVYHYIDEIGEYVEFKPSQWKMSVTEIAKIRQVVPCNPPRPEGKLIWVEANDEYASVYETERFTTKFVLVI